VFVDTAGRAGIGAAGDADACPRATIDPAPCQPDMRTHSSVTSAAAIAAVLRFIAR
jgi:hypothetical protein